MSIQRWKAGWIDHEGKQRQFIFDSLNTLMIARIDFALKFRHAFEEEAIPAQYKMDEVNHEDQGISCTQLRW
jgi:hypothetical protein